MSVRRVISTNVNSIQSVSDIIDTALSTLQLRAQYWALNERKAIQREQKLSTIRDNISYCKEAVSLKEKLNTEMKDPAFKEAYDKLLRGEDLF